MDNQRRLMTVPSRARPSERYREHMTRSLAIGRKEFMLAVPRSWDERRHPLPSFGRAHVRGPLFGLSVLSKVKPPTGEPCAEIRTHGSEGRESDLNRTSLPLSVINGRWPILDAVRIADKRARSCVSRKSSAPSRSVAFIRHCRVVG